MRDYETYKETLTYTKPAAASRNLAAVAIAAG